MASQPRVPFQVLRWLFMFSLLAVSGYGQVVLFSDEFRVPGTKLDTTKWTTERGPSSYLGRTQLADWLTPGGLGQFAVDSSGAQLALNTYNPTGSSMYGTHAKTVPSFAPGPTSGIEYRARLRLTSLQRGVVYAIYFYGCSDETSCATRHNEIDIELVTNFLQPGGQLAVQLNSYAEEPLGAGHGQKVNLPAGFDPLGAHDWIIRWSRQRIEYLVDGILLASRTTHVPSSPMQANVIAWAPSTDWAEAYSADLQPAGNAAGNQRNVAILSSVKITEYNENASIHGVANAASYDDSAVAPGEVVTLFGRRLGPATLAGAALYENDRLATTIADTRVLFDGIAAPIVYVSEAQSAVVVPYQVAGRSRTEITVELGGITSEIFSMRVAETHPGLFSQDQTGQGQGAIYNEDATLNTPSNPAARGSVISLYGTGEGQTIPAGVDGQLATAVVPKPVLQPSVMIGGVPAAAIQYYGAVPGQPAGLFQINVTVPESLAAPGQHPVQVQFGSAISQPGLLLSIR